MSAFRQSRDKKIEAARILCEAGWLQRDVAEVLGYATATSISQMGVKREKPDDPRIDRIVSMYRDGSTLSEIAVVFEISRERVRQILASCGIGKKDGGLAARKSKSARAEEEAMRRKMERLDNYAFKRFGCSHSELDRINAGMTWTNTESPAHLYWRQRRSAIQRCIGWEFTLPEWWAVWEMSGKWSQRGRGASAFCMARIGDKGPYSTTNVKICTNKENICEGYVFRGAGHVVREKANKAYALRLQGMSHRQIAEHIQIKPSGVGGYVALGKRYHAEASA